MPYDDLMVAPMREELTRLGVEELRDAADVSRWMDDHTGSALLFFNSVCGCAAGMARPGLALALQNAHRPNRVATVFAGQDMEATAAARKAIAEVPPSSPSAALFKDGQLVFFLPRHAIEGRDARDVGADLAAAFDRFCA
ncbi:MAG: BrxA/BrxB family bacilliredoxin [Candidatus Krumholzibacteriia bacterium]|nr:BrxA/BrxB family bacilliredoxin [bacterium]MCB9516788.1 BrxA/BrxB family bacilliredoxin [Candidatus Latescibacterota bacterium]